MHGRVPYFHGLWQKLCQGNLYTNTVHAINGAILKLGKLTPAQKLYRGINGMRLPKEFLVEDIYKIRGGAEFGFMSATPERSVALHYASEREPSVVFEIQQGLVDRGAEIAWISQYPHEGAPLWRCSRARSRAAVVRRAARRRVCFALASSALCRRARASPS